MIVSPLPVMSGHRGLELAQLVGPVTMHFDLG